MNIVFLDTKTLGKVPNLSLLEKFGNVSFFQSTSAEDVAARIRPAEVVITNKVVINRQLIDEAPNLKLICIAATGTNNVDLEYAAKKNITVKNAVGYSTKSVAQFTFNSLFYLLHQTQYYDLYVKSGSYCKSDTFTHVHHNYWELEGKTFGIIGLGSIGKAVAAIAEAFGAHVIYFSTSGNNKTKDYRRVDLPALLSESDVISIHAPLNEKTQGLISINELHKMKREAILINMGRGGIVDERALATALDSDIIAAAALDVLDTEPIQRDNPLLSIKNKEKLLITPHIAWASIEARTRLVEIVCGHLEEYLAG